MTALYRCCEFHNSNCEPPSELCCDRCTEIGHPRHTDGGDCVLDVTLDRKTDRLNNSQGEE